MRQIVFTIFIYGLFVVNTYAQWSQAINGMGNQVIGSLLADGDTLYATSSFDVFKSTNQGDNWFTINNGLPAVVNFNAMTKSGQFFVTGGEGIWLSSNNGANWFRTTSGVDSNEYVFSLLADGNTVYAGLSDPSAVGISTNNGNTWTKSTNGIASSQFITGVTKLGSSLFATHMALGVYESTDNGVSWSLHSGAIGAQDKNAIVTSGSNLCVAATNGVWTSTDNGVTWEHTLTTSFLTGFNKHGNHLYVIGSLPPYRSSDNGITWAAVDDNGLVTSVNNTIQFTSDYAFVNTFGIGVYRRSLSEITSVIINDQGNLVENFRLEQNYPNPFNPSTKISWQSPVGGHQSLKVYDVLGNEIATLVDEYRDAGIYEVEFNAKNLASGMYLYRIQTGSFAETKKMIIMR